MYLHLGCSIKCVPKDYGSSFNSAEDEAVVCAKFPVLNWSKDVYADWLLTNSSSLNTQKDFGKVGVGVGLLTAVAGLSLMASAGGSLPLLMAGGGFLGSGLSSSLSSMNMVNQAVATDIDHSKIPDSIQGLASGGDINFCMTGNTFFFNRISIKPEFAEMIDHYFDMYGYKVNSLEVPNLTSRRNWNFLKIIDPNVEGDIVPESDMNKYKEQLKQGITFWHDPTTFRDYSQSNGNS